MSMINDEVIDQEKRKRIYFSRVEERIVLYILKSFMIAYFIMTCWFIFLMAMDIINGYYYFGSKSVILPPSFNKYFMIFSLIILTFLVSIFLFMFLLLSKDLYCSECGCRLPKHSWQAIKNSFKGKVTPKTCPGCCKIVNKVYILFEKKPDFKHNINENLDIEISKKSGFYFWEKLVVLTFSIIAMIISIIMIWKGVIFTIETLNHPLRISSDFNFLIVGFYVCISIYLLYLLYLLYFYKRYCPDCGNRMPYFQFPKKLNLTWKSIVDSDETCPFCHKTHHKSCFDTLR